MSTMGCEGLMLETPDVRDWLDKAGLIHYSWVNQLKHPATTMPDICGIVHRRVAAGP